MKFFILLVLSVLTACSGKGQDPVEPGGGETPPEPVVRALLAPESLSLTEAGGKVSLSWKDRSSLEEGYLVSKKASSGKKTEEFFLPANTESWTDEKVWTGVTLYTVRSYWHTDRSPEASVSYEEYDAPQMEVVSVQSSYHMAAVIIRVISDGGEPVTCGVTATREDGTDVREAVFGEKVNGGETACLLLEDLAGDAAWYLVPWVRNGREEVRGERRTVSLKPAPEPVTIDWSSLSAEETLPEGLSLFSATTDVFGRVVNLWCAVADLTAGTVEFRTTAASSVVEPGKYIRETLSGEGEVLALVNGGYFAAPSSSYSYVCDRGVKKASNVTQLTRTRGYTVTRGFFGVDRAGHTAIGWISGDDFYTRPLPVYDGGPVLSLPGSLPSLQGWEPHSAIGGGPVLIKDGRYCFDYLKSPSSAYLSNHELFQSDIFASGLCAPRTAVGTDGKGKVVLLVADGRGSGGSGGLTLDELARVMAGLGCTDVLNLDGGGSSMFLTGSEGTLRNHPSDGHERKVLSFVSFMRKQE